MAQPEALQRVVTRMQELLMEREAIVVEKERLAGDGSELETGRMGSSRDLVQRRLEALNRELRHQLNVLAELMPPENQPEGGPHGGSFSSNT